jgi:hypothetical protein
MENRFEFPCFFTKEHLYRRLSLTSCEALHLEWDTDLYQTDLYKLEASKITEETILLKTESREGLIAEYKF